MKTKDFVLNCLCCYSSACEYMDELQDAFGVELEEDDVLDALRTVSEQLKIDPFALTQTKRNPELGNALITKLFDIIIDSAVDEYQTTSFVNEFDYDVEDYCSRIYFNGTHVQNWDELCTAIDEWLETKNQK